MHLFIGTSGYSYPKWKGRFYPEKLPQKQMLGYYAERFGAVEINNTFYKMPVASDITSWAEQVPKSFRFALKAPQTITHFKRLKDAEEPTAQFFHIVAALQSSLGPVLVGLPPNFKRDLPRLRAFLQFIPKKQKVAFEFRHPSWFDEEVYDCLRKHKVALCIAHTEELSSPEMISTAAFGYVRLRCESYSAKDLAQWAERIQTQPWQEAYVFFKHEDTATGPKFAAQFHELTGD